MKRIDVYLVEAGHFKTRHQAQIEIKHGRVLKNNQVIMKPSVQVTETDKITLLEPFNPYVSLGGLKLEKAIQVFALDFNQKTILDVGSSTGGFTDCALKHGATKIYAFDVGSKQMVDALRNHEAVHLFEQTNFLTVHSESIDHIDYTVMDVSFTSSIPLIKHAHDLTNTPIIVLIKPQFETTLTPKSGIIKDIKIHKKVLSDYQTNLNKLELYIQKLTYSPQKGGSGNIEFLALIENKKHYVQTDPIVLEAHETLT